MERESSEGMVDERPGVAGELVLPWIEPPAELVATAQDLGSYRRFLVLYNRDEAKRKRLLGRPRSHPFLIRFVGGRESVAAFESWREVVAWHDRTLNSPGWQVLKTLPEMN